jgi:hypothetical protein
VEGSDGKNDEAIPKALDAGEMVKIGKKTR